MRREAAAIVLKGGSVPELCNCLDRLISSELVSGQRPFVRALEL